MKPTYQLSASLVCANMLRLADEIKYLEQGGIDYIHFDVMDGHLVPRYGLHPEILSAVKSISKLPVEVHMMVNNPEPYIPVFVDAGAKIITVHAEACQHLHRTIALIHKAGAKAGVALNPATSLSVLDYVLPDIQMVMLMAIDPGILGQGLIPSTLQKITDLRERTSQRQDLLIGIDGGVTPKTAGELLRHGANYLVCGSGTIFRPHEAPLKTKIKELRKHLDATIKN